MTETKQDNNEILTKLDSIQGMIQLLDMRMGRFEVSLSTMETRLENKIETEIEGLAIMVKHGFDGVERRFDEKLEVRFAM